jgi:hypothetical protein
MSAKPSIGSVSRYPTIVTETMTVADTEYDTELPENCKDWLIHTRDESSFRLAFETGHVDTPVEPYFTVPAGKSVSMGDFFNSTQAGERVTLYYASGSAGKVIELIYWT